MSRQLEIFRLLLKTRVSIKLEEGNRMNCLHLPAKYSSKEVLSEIIEHCIRVCPEHLDQPSDEGLSPLGVAISHGRQEAVQFLLGHEANPSTAWPDKRGHVFH